MTTERAGCAKNGDKVQPHPQQFQSLSQKSPASFPRLPHRCQTSATPAAGWIADGAVQAGGRPPGLVVTCGGNREEAEAGVLRWQPCHRLRGPGQASHRTCPRLRSPSSDGISVGTAGRACGGLWGLWPRDSCRTRTTPCPAGLVRAGAARQRQPPVGCGHHPATLGPRACCATPVHDFHAPPKPISEGKARVRPSGLTFCSITPAEARAGVSVHAASFRSRGRHPARPSIPPDCPSIMNAM